MKFSKTETNQSTVEQKKEIRSFLNDYQSINNDTTITEKAKMVLSLLLYTGNGQDKFTIGYNYIEEVTGISKNGISAIIGRLEKKGFINRTKGERGKNSEYTINYDTMKSYVAPSVSKCPKKVYKCTSNQVSKCTTCTPNTTCTPKSTDFQVLTNKIDELIQVSKCTSEWLEKIYNLYLNININNNINLNDKNDTTEGYNIKDHNEKENITEDNLEILKENTTVEITNDEDIQSEIENTSRDNISDNEIPSDLPPLNIDDFFEDSNDNLIEYRSNENNISNELEFSIFGNDIISEDENLNNDTTVKFIDGKFQVVSETEDEINSSSDVEDKNKINLNLNNMDNSSNTISKVEISNNENNISFEKDNSKVESSKDNYEIWGKLQPVFEKTSNKLVEYLFTEYENLNDSKNVSDGYHQVKQYISIDNDKIKVSVNQNGSFGILSFKDNVYSFIPCNSNIISERYHITQSCAAETAETSNNALQAVKMSQVDNYTTDTEKIAPVQPKMPNKAYTNPDPNNPKVWEYIKLHLTMKQGSHLMRDVLDEYKEIEAKNIHSVIAYMEDMCKAVRSALEKGLINEMQFNDFKRVFQTLSKGKYNYWRKVFSTRSPKSLMSSEMKMWGILGKPKITENAQNDAETSTVNNYTNGTEKTAGNTVKMPQDASNNTVVYPNLDELYKMGYDEAIATLQKFVSEHPNLTQKQKVYFNENISAAFGIQLYDND